MTLFLIQLQYRHPLCFFFVLIFLFCHWNLWQYGKKLRNLAQLIGAWFSPWHMSAPRADYRHQRVKVGSSFILYFQKQGTVGFLGWSRMSISSILDLKTFCWLSYWFLIFESGRMSQPIKNRGKATKQEVRSCHAKL